MHEHHVIDLIILCRVGCQQFLDPQQLFYSESWQKWLNP